MTTALIVALCLSVILNVVFTRYAVVCARKLLVVATNLYSLQDSFVSFRAHVETLHETEMYYGDQSLQALIDHTKSILGELDRHEDIYTLVLEDEEEELGFDQDFEEEEEEEN